MGLQDHVETQPRATDDVRQDGLAKARGSQALGGSRERLSKGARKKMRKER